MFHLSVWFFCFTIVASTRNYLFPGCEVSFNNNFAKTDALSKILLFRWNTTMPMKVQVTQPESGKTFNPIEVPILEWKWTSILVNMTEKLSVVLPDGSTYPSEALRESINKHHIKEIQVLDAYSAIDCPQGLPYKTVGSRNWLGFPPTGAKGEAFLIMPTVDLKPQLLICRSSCHKFFICPSEDVDQLKVQESGDNCSQLSEYHFYKLQFYFESRELKVISERKELWSFSVEDRHDDIWFSTDDAQSSMVVVHCMKGNCDGETPDLPQIGESEDGTTDLPQIDESEDGTTDLPQIDTKSCIIAWGPPTAIAILLAVVLIIGCFRHRHQINKLRAANNRQIPTVHFQNTPHSNAPTATHSTTPTAAGESVMTENDIYVSLDEIR